MGLAERRASKEFETKRYPAFKKEIDEAAGFELPVEVRWETMQAEGYAHLYDDSYPKVYFRPLIQALKNITFDDMGKEAVKTGLKKVIIQNTTGNYSGGYMAQFQDGVLTLEHEPCSNVDYEKERIEGIQKLLESKL